MNAMIILSSFALFLTCLATHVILWRVRRPAKGAMTLCVIFLLLPAMALSAYRLLFADAGKAWLLTALEVYALHCSLSLAYIASYPAVRAVSPSLDILLTIDSSGSGSLTENEIIERYDDATLITDKVDILRVYNLVRDDSGMFRLTTPARLIVLIFVSYRSLLGLEVGKG